MQWSTRAGVEYRSRISATLPPGVVKAMLEIAQRGLEEGTVSNYGAGLLQYHQLCNEYGIAEDDRFPALEYLIAALISRHMGTVQAKTISRWLSGLRFFLAVNGVEWCTKDLLLIEYAKKGSKKAATPSKPPRPPMTHKDMEALVNALDMGNTFDVVVFALTCTVFWGCQRLGELTVPSVNAFDPERHVARSMKIGYATFDIPWMKSTGREGADVVLTGISGFLDPVTALQHHVETNKGVPGTAPLFAFESAEAQGWSPMTRDWFLNRCNAVWKLVKLAPLTGHCFRIRGATELLLHGVHPDVVAMQGTWHSDAFLKYWWRIETIIPQFVLEGSDAARIERMQESMQDWRRCNRL
ncbi:hypothetical protein C8T65DRAFT_709241 [Cerioporus squamosus]|nr:hypothetical protein C8T65DRAFT_709241 [Cerioporus squamosus]